MLGSLGTGTKLGGKALGKVDDVVAFFRKFGKADEAVDLLKNTENVIRPSQVHHFITNKSSKYTNQFNEVIEKYGLSLNDDWNKQSMPHQGRHPNAYHDWMLEEVQSIDNAAQGNKDAFLNMFEDVRSTVTNNPDMLRKSFWN